MPGGFTVRLREPIATSKFGAHISSKRGAPRCRYADLSRQLAMSAARSPLMVSKIGPYCNKRFLLNTSKINGEFRSGDLEDSLNQKGTAWSLVGLMGLCDRQRAGW